MQINVIVPFRQTVFWSLIFCSLALIPYRITAQDRPPSYEKEFLGNTLDSIYQLSDPDHQFEALLLLSRRNAWRMNPFTVQYLEELQQAPPGSPIIPAAVYFLLGEFLNVNLQQFSRSLFFYQKAGQMTPHTEQALQLRIWERISALSLQFSKLQEAIPATDSCIRKAEQQSQWFTLAHCLKCKGDIRRDYFQEQPGQITAYRDALTNYQKSFHENLEQKDTLAALLNLFFMSSIYLEIDSSYYQAAAYIDTAFSLITKAGKYDDFRAQNSFLKGKLLTRQGQFPQALKVFEEAYHQFSANKDTARLFQTGLLVGEIYYKQARYALAVQHLESSLTLSPKVISTEYRRDIQYLLYQSYKKLGDNERALTAQEAYIDAKDQINRTDQLRWLAATEAERGLQAKQKEIQEQQVELEKRYFINRFLIAGTVLLLASLALLFFSFMRSRRSRDELARRNEIILEQKQKLEELDNLKSRFFTNVSHELRTPLTLILAPINRILEKKQLAKEEKALLETAAKNTLMLQQLVDELLDFSKIESGKTTLQLLPRNVDQLIRQITDGFYPLARNRHIQLEYHNLVPGVQAAYLDQQAFQKILHNLLSNALKFSPENSLVKVMLSEHERMVRISVVDNGPGIHADDLPYIFDRFYQSRHENEQLDHSTGIGLALSAELALLMQGRLWVASERGAGSSFFLELPAAPDLPPPGQSAGVDLPEARSVGGRSKVAAAEVPPAPGREAVSDTYVLIVEDHADLRNYLAALLGEYYQVYTATNGLEALEILTEPETPLLTPGKGLVISDVMMPKMNGFDLLQAIKSNERYSGLPVILLTALKNHSDRLKALTVGVDDYLVKPFDNQELLIRVQNLLGRSKERSLHLSADPSAETEDKNDLLIAKALGSDPSQRAWLKDLEDFSLRNISNSQFGVAFLSSYANMSERNFQRHIKKATGMTPSEYIKELRLHHARLLLESGRIESVKAVSRAVGFHDQEYFSTVFQGRFGRKPSTYLG